MLTDALIEQILTSLPQRRIGLIGDLFLDRYLDIDGQLTEPSIETGLDAYQVTQVRANPGALGTIINNLVALGVGTICPIAVIGDDGEGYELGEALALMSSVQSDALLVSASLRTPTYTKPMLHIPGQQPRELNRFDIKNRRPMKSGLVKEVLAALDSQWDQVDAWLVLDQVSEVDCGVISSTVRKRIAELAQRNPNKFVLADSRERIHEFQSVCVKPNEREGAAYPGGPVQFDRTLGRHVFLTRGEKGLELYAPDGSSSTVPAYPVEGPIDIVGAGDSTSAGIACAIAAGATIEQAAAFGNLVASITIQQLGTTGTASPDQVRLRWLQVSRV
jgi:bifunctional ADP-heptose synthase (sugar kinase/adenylyltransferase)